MTFESLIKNPNNRHTHIKANGKIFYSDVEALKHISEQLSPKGNTNRPALDGRNSRLADYLARKGALEFCIKGVDHSDDWKTEPEQTFEQLCDRMCEILEQTYQEIYISYSGGTDSDTIAEAFMRRGTRGVTLVNVANNTIQMKTEARQWLAKHTGDAVKAKYAGAIANLGWKVLMFQGWQPNDHSQYEKNMVDNEFMSWLIDFTNTNTWAQNSGRVTLTRADKRSCWVMGYEKPHLTVDKGWFCFQMHHNLFNAAVSCVDPNSDLIYFWLNDIVPDLIKKMAHSKCREIKNILKEQGHQPTTENVESMNSPRSPHYQRINRAMGLGGLTRFLQSRETHTGGSWRKLDLLQQHVVMDAHKPTIDKMNARDRYFEEVILKQTHSDFIDTEQKAILPIKSKSIPISPVGDC